MPALGEQELGRRAFLRRSAFAFANFYLGAEITAGVGGIALTNRLLGPLDEITDGVAFFHLSETNITKPYDLTMGNSYVLVGDSNARGKIAVSGPAYPSVEFITNGLYKKGFKNWEIANLAVERETTQQTLQRLQMGQLDALLSMPGKRDIVIGTAGDNPREIVEDEFNWQELTWLKEHPQNQDRGHNVRWNLRAARMALKIVGNMDESGVDFGKMLDYLLKKKKINPNAFDRVIVLGVADISRVPSITVQKDDGKYLPPIAIATNPVVARSLSHISLGLNNRLKQQIAKRYDAFHKDIHFINPMRLEMEPADMREVHFTKSGQDKIGEALGGRSMTTTGMTLNAIAA